MSSSHEAGSVERCSGDAKSETARTDLMLGQFMVTSPDFGELQVYLKRDGRTGVSFVSHQDARKYGVTRAVQARFTEAGEYPGWAYVNVARLVVFRFFEQPREEVPDDWVAIWYQGQHVSVPAKLRWERKPA